MSLRELKTLLHGLLAKLRHGAARSFRAVCLHDFPRKQDVCSYKHVLPTSNLALLGFFFGYLAIQNRSGHKLAGL
jgi:hypothetical protein